MANSKQILNKIARNMSVLGIPYTQSADTVTVTVSGAADLTITYESASIDSPMGGVSDASAPFLGIGTANPGKIVITGASGDTAIANIFDTVQRCKVLALCAAFANNIVIHAFAGTVLGEISGHSDLIGMGQ